MLKYLYYIFLSTLCCSCVGDGETTSSNENQTPEVVEVVKRYGIPVEGYQITENRVRSGQTMGNIMSSHGRTPLDIDRLDRAAKEIFPLKNMKAGQTYVTFTAVDSLGTERLDYIAYERNMVDYVLFSMGDSISVNLGSKPVRVERNRRTATISSSLWGAVMESHLPYSLATEMEEVYQWSVDFFGIQSGDNFTVIYDEKFVEDTISVGIGKIWGAKFQQGGKDYYAVPFQQGDKLEYWDELGGSLRKQMLKAPLKYSRISSRFSNARLHPIYKVYRPHHGVDYAAPTGTPVHAVADGVVTFKGWGGGGGNTLKIKHPNNVMTGYLHLSRYAKGIVQGTKVSQGQLIGYVGSTGASTGPHLDYRVWKGGKAIDPLKVPQTPSEPISEENKSAFEQFKNQILSELDGEQEEQGNMLINLPISPSANLPIETTNRKENG